MKRKLLAELLVVIEVDVILGYDILLSQPKARFGPLRLYFLKINVFLDSVNYVLTIL